MLRKGDWEGAQLIGQEAVRMTTNSAGLPGENGMGWWTNADGRFSPLPKDAFWASGAGHQTLLVVPSLNLICVRNGGPLSSKKEEYREARVPYLFEPLMDAITDAASGNHGTKAPYAQSTLIELMRVRLCGWFSPDVPATHTTASTWLKSD
jgi:CubicO group peptidase (beta-lactamase class C family)